MRKSILAIAAALAFVSANVMATGSTQYHTRTNYDGGLVQGSTASAGTISGATTVGTGFAGTYGIANMNAVTTGKLNSGPSIAAVGGTTLVTGHTESGTLVEGAGAAGSIAGGDAKGYVYGGAEFDTTTHQHSCYWIFCSPGYNYETEQAGEAGILAKSKGSAWSATGSYGPGEGVSVNGFEAYGDAKAKADVDYEGRGRWSTESDVQTASGALTYTLETGNAIGNTKALGLGLGHADAYRVHD